MNWTCEVKLGKIPEITSKLIKACFEKMEGKRVVITVSEWKPKRSLCQNRLMWKWLSELSDQTGNDVDALHEYFKRRFLGCDSLEVMGEVVEIPKSTTKLKVGEMAGYLTKIEQEAVSNGYQLTIPVDYRFAIYGDDK